jgi:ABC-2 type transport system permease protein
MRANQAAIVAKREYLARVKTRGFWIATAVLPLMMVALVVGPSLAASRSHAQARLAIVDTTGAALAGDLTDALAQTGMPSAHGEVLFSTTVVPPLADAGMQRRNLNDLVRQKTVDGWLWLDAAGLQQGAFEYHSESVSNLVTLEVLKSRVSAVVSRWRLRQAGLDSAKIAALTRPTDLKTVRISATGSHAEQGVGGFMVAFFLCFLLYITILIYGSQVMQGVIEEKNSRVVEVIASTIRPTELMAGKLVGICLVALTQLTIWVAIAALVRSPAVAAWISLPAGISLPTIAPAVVVHLFVLFLLGFFLYSTLYAMIGASFNSVQEAQQFAGIAIVFIVPPMLFIMPIINAPDSNLAVGMSLFPFFTPLVMMLRIATKMPPAWQIAAGYSLCLATIAGMVWLCARVYRVGILMYGKKPTLREIARWVRYS